MNLQCSGGSRSFTKETRGLKWGAPWLAIRRWQWPTERILKANPLTTNGRSCPRTQHWLLCGHLAFEAKWKGVKARYVSASLADHKSKIVILECHLLLYCATTVNHFLIGSWHMTKSEFYTTTSTNQLSGWTQRKLQRTSQSQICPPKRSWSLFGVSLLVWSTTAFWIPVQPWHMRRMLSRHEMHWKLHGLPPAPVNREGPVLLCDSAWLRFAQPVIHKLKFCLICHVHPTSHQLPNTSSSILTTFLRGKCFHNQQDAENTFQVFLESRSTDFYATGNKFISYWQKCIDCNGSYCSLIKICLRLIIMI